MDIEERVATLERRVGKLENLVQIMTERATSALSEVEQLPIIGQVAKILREKMKV